MIQVAQVCVNIACFTFFWTALLVRFSRIPPLSIVDLPTLIGAKWLELQWSVYGLFVFLF